MQFTSLNISKEYNKYIIIPWQMPSNILLPIRFNINTHLCQNVAFFIATK